MYWHDTNGKTMVATRASLAPNDRICMTVPFSSLCVSRALSKDMTAGACPWSLVAFGLGHRCFRATKQRHPCVEDASV